MTDVKKIPVTFYFFDGDHETGTGFVGTQKLLTNDEIVSLRNQLRVNALWFSLSNQKHEEEIINLRQCVRIVIQRGH